MNYVKLHTDALSAYRRLSDTEFGRAVRAILQYVEDGSEPSLPGKESIMFDVLREQVERDRASYEQKLNTQRANGSRGGRPRKNAKPSETQQNPWVFEKPSETQKTQEKEKEKEYISPVAPFLPDDDADALMADQRKVLDAAGAAGFPHNAATYDRLISLTAEYSPEWVLAAVERCVEQGTSKVAYLAAVLAGFRRDGGPGVGKKAAAAADDDIFAPLWR